MASSSAYTASWKYDVFLSFRGEDTRRNFTSFLHAELSHYGITTFIDDQLRKGDQISTDLLQAIQDSRFSIVIFSQNYASSNWCLDELVKILECVHKGEHTAFPVFYEMDPSDVRHQRGSYEEAFRKHEEAHKNNMEKVVKWREALTTGSGYSGWDTRYRNHSEVIKEIVFKIFNKVPANSSSSNKIGMNSRIKAVLSLLHRESQDVRMVGIWGMAGVGKTTLAEAIYQEIRTEFEGCCFLSNVREKSQTIENLEMELLSKILQKDNLHIRNFYMEPKSISKALHSKQVLIVLDDVNHRKQLEQLVGSRDWFGPKSRIIITTRDKRLLIQNDMDAVYETKELQNEDAFKGEPFVEDFKELCDRSLDYTKGNPLAIEILGSHLYKRNKKEWNYTLKKLKKFPNVDVQKVLMISYDGLEETEKKIFLDIACFLKEEDKDHASELLECCDFYSEIGISTLVDRALITISDDNRLCMHGLIQEMGWEIVRQESTMYPGKRSRLWLYDDFKHVLTKNKGTEIIEGIALDLSTSKESLDLKVDAFKRMEYLRWLEIRIFEKWLYDFGRQKLPDPKMHLSEDFEFPSENLRYLRWEGYPLKSLPSNFDPMKLFELNMRFSWLTQLWEGIQSFQNLVYMDLSHSPYLFRTPDLSGAPKLRKIYLEGCTSLVEVHSSIATRKKLSFVNLRNCSKLEKLADSFSELMSLESVDFSGCSRLRMLPNDLKLSSPYLDLSGCSKLEQLPKGIGELASLKTPNLSGYSKSMKWPDGTERSLVSLNLFGCSKLHELPESIGELTSLRTLNLAGCSKLKKFPNEVQRLQRLEKLVADGSGIQEVPHCIARLTRLKELSLGGSKIGGSSSPRQELQLPRFLESLKLRDYNLQEVGEISTVCLLRYLDLSGNSFVSLPSLTPLTQLSELRLERCKSLRALPELPLSIETVVAFDCESLETFSHPPNSYAMSKSSELKFDFLNCGRLLENKESLEAILDGIRIRNIHPIWGNRSFGAVVPGTSVPDWFIHRSVENSIIVKLPPDFHHLKALGLGFCAVLGPNLYFGYESAHMISYEIESKRVSHLKFSFPLAASEFVVKEFGIRLLYSPVQCEEMKKNRLLCSGIERETVNATIFSPPPTLISYEERLWETTIAAKHPKYNYLAQRRKWTPVFLLTHFIKVEGFNMDVPHDIVATSLT